MTKKVLFMLAMLTCIFASCSDGGSDDPVNPTPKPEEVKAEITLDSTIESNGLSFGASAGDNSVSFTTNTNWTLTVSSTTSGTTWCTASATSGSKGSATVKFTVTENTEYDDRSVSVTVKAGTASKTFKITQKGVDALLVTTSSYEVAQEGGSIEVEVKANIDYQLEISETAKDWITEAKSKSRALKATNHKFDIALNEEAEKREGEIIFKSGDKVETVKVYQAGGSLIMLTQNEMTVSDAGETISVEIKSNVEFGVQMPEVDWITDEASSRGMSSHTLKYVIAQNEGYDSRSAEIIFYDKNSDLKDTLKVIQAQKDAIVISEKNVSVAKEGDTVEIKVNTNVDFEVQIPSDATWVTQTDSRALTEKSVYLKVEENMGDDSRSATITIINQDTQLSETIVLIQQGNTTIVTLKEAGTLKTLLGNDYLKIKSLKVVGPINGDDVYYLRKMLGGSNFSEADRGKLSTLDLSEASIVEGGEWYYSYEDNNITKEYKTSNDIIGAFMFYECPNLKNIDLPNNIISIGSSAFEGCSSLTSISIPKCVTTVSGGIFKECSSLESIELPDGITSIPNYTFYDCIALTTIVLPDDIISIGMGAFRNCSSLKSINIPNGVTKIDQSAFLDCSSLTSIDIPNGVTSIGGSAFKGCKAITSINIPNGVTTIEEFTFYWCNSLILVTLGKGITSMGDEVFYDCSSLTQLYCYATTPPQIKSNNSRYTFHGLDGYKATLYVPARCGSKYKTSDWGKYFENIIEMEE